ncbi:MAG: hypothetical protein LWW91_03540 [Bacteroidales bacterium]|nr:hypothetical protein [Bacteroidales bacterium]
MPIDLPLQRVNELVKTCKYLYININHPQPSPESFLHFAINQAISETLVFPPAASDAPDDDEQARTVSTATRVLPPHHLSLAEQVRIRKYWGECLTDLFFKYEEKQTEEEFEKDMLALYKKLFLVFPSTLRNPEGFDSYGLKLISAQLSLALWLKQLWCVGSIPAPPACPLSTNILMLSTRYPDLQLWRHVNSMEEYRERMREVHEEAGDVEVAKWELLQQLAAHHLEVSGKLGL